MALSAGLTSKGMIIVKENRPYGGQRENRFHMETPQGEQGRYDITRPKMHHEVRRLISSCVPGVICSRTGGSVGALLLFQSTSSPQEGAFDC